MTTIRVARRSRFTMIDRRTLNDDRLSFRARGILAWLLDKPDDWSCTSEAIAAATTEGRGAVRTALRELETCGYLKRQKIQGENGRWSTIVAVYELPQPTQGELPVTETEDQKPAVGFPVAKSQELKQRTTTGAIAPEGEKPTKHAHQPEAQRLAKAEWERRKTAGTPMPCGGFVAFMTRVREALEAGHPPDLIAEVMPAMTTFTRGSFDFVLNLHTERQPTPSREWSAGDYE